MPPSAASASKVGDTPADFPGAVTGAVAGAVHIGDTPADFPRAVTGAVVHVGDTPVDFPRTVSCAVRIGDTPADFPGASGSPASIPVAAPVSHDTGGVDVPQVLAIALLSVALALALFAAVALARTQGVRRRLAGRVH